MAFVREVEGKIEILSKFRRREETARCGSAENPCISRVIYVKARRIAEFTSPLLEGCAIVDDEGKMDYEMVAAYRSI